MYTYGCTCMHVCVYIFIYTHICVCMYIYIYIYIYTYRWLELEPQAAKILDFALRDGQSNAQYKSRGQTYQATMRGPAGTRSIV